MPSRSALQALRGAAARGSTRGPVVVVDLAGVPALDAAGVAELGDARAQVVCTGRRFALANVSLGVLDALCATGGDLLRSVAATGVAAGDDSGGDAGSVVDRARLIAEHRRFADRLAGRFAGRGQPLDDLRQVAYLGLLMAARRYDATREVHFAAYAQATIVGELKRYFRDHSWHLHVPRPVQDLYLAVRDASEEMTQTLGRTPTPAELAVELGVTEEEVIDSLEARSALRVDSLDALPSGDDGAWLDQSALEDGYRSVEERSWLVPALRALPERERRILKLRFFDGLPQSAIAAQVGVSQMHVSRLIARSLRTLRAAANE